MSEGGGGDVSVMWPRNRIDVPAPPIAVGGFLAGAQVINVTDGDHSLMGAEYESTACFGDPVRYTGSWCEVAEPVIDCEARAVVVPPDPKYFYPASGVYDGMPFALYQGVECDMQPSEQSLAQVKEAYAYGERRSIDQTLMLILKNHPNLYDPGMDPAPPAVVLGFLEQEVARSYGGTALIAIPMQDIPAFCQAQLIAPNIDGTFSSCQGSTIIGTASYDNDHALYAMGRMVLIRGPLNTYSAPPQMIGCPDGSYISQPARALAERIYVSIIECEPIKSIVKPCDCTGMP